MLAFKPHQGDHGVETETGRRQAWPAMLLVAVLLTFVCSRASSLLSYPEFSLLDMWMRSRPPRVVSPDIVLVGIEDKDAKAFRLERESHPDPRCRCGLIRRDHLAEVITAIKQAGAKVVGTDMIFAEHCPLHDEPFFRALGLPQDTVIMTGTNPTPGKFEFHQMPELLKQPHPLTASPVLYSPRGIIRAVRLIQRDKPDLTKESEAVFHVGGNAPPPFALACYAAYRGHGEEVAAEDAPNRVRCVDTEIPVWHSERIFMLEPLSAGEDAETSMNSMLINWAGPPGIYPTYSITTLRDAPPEVRRRKLEGKIVLVGDMTDRQVTPMSENRTGANQPLAPSDFQPVDQSAETNVTGMEVHANALDTVIQRRFIRVPPLPLMWLFMVGLSVLVLVVFRRVPGWRAAGLSLGFIAAVFVLARLLMLRDIWLFAVTPTAVVVLTAVSGAVLSSVMAREEAAASQATAEEERRQRYEAQQRLVAALDALRTVVHDTKQPLAAINALAQVLRLQQVRGGQLDLDVIERIQGQVKAALADIDELLSTDPNRALNLAMERFDLAALARDLAVPQSLKTGVHTVEVDAPAEGMWVTGDPRYLGRALSNLMDNAIKYWPSGGTVRVEIKREPGRVTTRVIDRGLGIARDAQARVFSQFQRAVPENMEIPGTGIGLFSVKMIIEAHGGTVELISAPGEGSIFIVNLPDTLTISQPMEGLGSP